jgi:Mlc titration factor MtfA (ptsG expression regulator)
MTRRRPGWKAKAVNWREEWKSFWLVPNLDTVSAYALHSPAEFWAECVEEYMKKGDRLRVKEPMMYALIKKWVFSDREFLKWLLGGILEWSAA